MKQQKIGILGGGQLGAMLLRSAIDFGLDIAVMDKDPEAACSHYTGSFQVGDLRDYDRVIEFGKDLDIITIEIEAVNAEALAELESRGVKVFPSPAIISMVQDKYKQKQFLEQHGLPVAPGQLVQNKAELKDKIKSWPVCLKLCREGYDGRGVMMLRSEADLESAFDAPCVIEEYVEIGLELSVIVARNEAGETRHFEPVAMMFDKRNNVLDYQLCPAPVSEAISAEACALARRVAEAAGLVGIMAVEMFVTPDNRVIVNELAPRPHNSGHHSIEACATSQFEQHLRAILNLPLGDTATLFSSAMVNLLGNPVLQDGVAGLRPLLEMDNVHLHWYGKQFRTGRKLGHATVKGASVEEVSLKADIIRNYLNNNHG